MSEVVTAVKGGETRDFPRKAWDEMPAGKYGWIPATEVPEEVQKLTGNNSSSPTIGLTISQEEYDSFKAHQQSLKEVADRLDARELELNQREQNLISREQQLEIDRSELEAEKAKQSVLNANDGANVDASISGTESGSTDSSKSAGKKTSK